MIAPEIIKYEGEVYVRVDRVSGALITQRDNTGKLRNRVISPNDIREIGEEREDVAHD